MSRFTRLKYPGLTILCGGLIACSGGTAPDEPEIEVSPLVLFPLTEKAVWRYNYTYTSNSNEAGTRGDRMVLSTTRGSMKLEVIQVKSSLFQRSYTLDQTFYRDSTDYEYFVFGEYDTTFTIYEPQIEHYTIDLIFDRDTVWYDYGNSGRKFMMTREYVPGSDINLRLFNLPGIDFFDNPLGSARIMGTGDYLYYAVDEHLDKAARIQRDVGVRSISAALGTGIRKSRQNWRDQTLRYGLIQF